MAAESSHSFHSRYQKLYFSFPEVPSTTTLRFEKLVLENTERLSRLFENDHSLFVDERFKTYPTAKAYTEHLVTFGRTLPKHGGQDWLFTWQQEDAGILHLYDLSLETIGRNNERAWVGIALHQCFRRKGIATIVLHHFIKYIFQCYPNINFIHAVTDKANVASQRLLLRCGFVLDPVERFSKLHTFFVCHRKHSEQNAHKK